MVPAEADAQAAPDRGFVELKYLDYRDWQPGANRMTVRSPSTVRRAAALGYARRRRIGRLRQHVGRLAALLQHAVGRIRAGRDRLSDGGRRQGDAVFQRHGDRRRRRGVVGTRLPVARRLARMADLFGRPQSHVGVRLRRRPTTASIRPTASWSTRRAIRSISWSASRRRCRRRPSYNRTSPIRRGTATTRIRTSLSTRVPITAKSSRGSRGTTSTCPGRTRRFACRIVTCTIRSASKSNALEATWFQPLPEGWSVAPSLRYYTQSAASFYYNPPFPTGYVPGQDYTADTRLSAFGAFTPAVTVAKSFPMAGTPS